MTWNGRSVEKMRNRPPRRMIIETAKIAQPEGTVGNTYNSGQIAVAETDALVQDPNEKEYGHLGPGPQVLLCQDPAAFHPSLIQPERPEGHQAPTLQDAPEAS